MKINSVLYSNGKEIPLLEKELTEKIIYAAIEVHKALGPGLLESAYQTCMVHESNLLKMDFEQQVPLVVTYKGVRLDGGYRLDLVYEKRVIVELKAVEEVLPVHEAQLLTTDWDSRRTAFEFQCPRAQERNLSSGSLGFVLSVSQW